MKTVLTQQQKVAANIRMRNWRANLSEEKKEQIRKENAERGKLAYHNNPEVRLRQQENFKRFYDENPEFRKRVVRSASLGRYKVTPEQYDAQLKEQGNHCALCESTDGDAGRRLHIDHDHACCDVGSSGRTCGKCNRGILCGNCNRRLAALEAILRDALVFPFLGKSDSWTAKALRYLQRYSTQKETQDGSN